MKHLKSRVWLNAHILPALALAVFGFVGLGSLIACSSEDEKVDENSGRDGDPDDSTGGNDGIGGAHAADDDASDKVGERWIVGGWLSTDSEYTGYLTVVDDLSTGGSIDLSQVVEFAGDMVYASPGGGIVYIGQGDRPTVERWEVSDENHLVKTGELSLQNYGVTNTLGGGRNVIQFVETDKAYYFDRENLQVITFNPQTMTTGASFSIDGMDEEGQELALNFVHRDGERFIITGRYWDLVEGTTTSLVRAAIVDSSNDSVAYIDDDRCGDIAFQVTDDEGNLYLGSHPGHAVYMAAGLDGEAPPPQCILRIEKGASHFDPDYFVNLSELSSGVVGGLLQGADNYAYVFHYDGGAITSENWRPALRGAQWSLYQLELENEEATYSAVDGLEGFTAYGSSFSTMVKGENTPFIIAVDADFSSGMYYDIADPTEPKASLSFPGFPGHAIAIH